MRCMRWLLLVTAALTATAATASDSLAELKQVLVASSQVMDGRRLLSIDLFEDHAARYLLAAADTSKEVTALFKLYKELHPSLVAAWGATDTRQRAYFEKNVFPNIEAKAKKLLMDSRSKASGTKTDDETAATPSSISTDSGDVTAAGNSPTSSSETSLNEPSTNRGTSISGGTLPNGGTSTNGGGQLSANDRGTSNGEGTTTSGQGTSTNRGGTSTNRGGTSTNGGGQLSANNRGASDGEGTKISGQGSSINGGGTLTNGGVTSPKGGTGGGTSTTGGGTSTTGGGTSTTGGGTPSNGGGTPSNGGGTPTNGGGTPSNGGGTPTNGGGTPTTGGGTPSTGGRTPSTGGRTPSTGGGTPSTGGGTPTTGGGTPNTGGVTSISSRTSTSSGTLTASSTSSPRSSASGTSFWVSTYNPQLSSTVGSLSSQTGTVQTVVQSSSASSLSSQSAASQYTSPTIIKGYTSPSRRYLTNGASDSSNIDVLFCDIEGNAIWKWSAEDVPDATVTNSSSSMTQIDVDVDDVCSATTTLTVSAYQTGCSLQNHPEGCDNVYYKGCGGITVSPTSGRIVIARTGGRTLGVLNYKSVNNTCQGQVVDAITTYRGKKFNSPTYAEYASNGVLYFTDSPFGLATSDADFDGDTLDKSPLREIPFNGVYMLRNGTGQSVELVDCEMARPNKIAFSPAQDVMYITNSQKGNSYVKSYLMADDGTYSNSSVFFNFTAHPELETDAGYAKGIKVDDNGNVYVVCYKGVYIFSPEAELAGVIMSSEELDSISIGLGRLFISGSFGLVAQTISVPSQALPQASVTCSA